MSRPYQRKTYDEWRLESNYGNGWEEVLTESTYAEIKLRLREYRENAPEWPYRIVKRRVRILRRE